MLDTLWDLVSMLVSIETSEWEVEVTPNHTCPFHSYTTEVQQLEGGYVLFSRHGNFILVGLQMRFSQRFVLIVVLKNTCITHFSCVKVRQAQQQWRWDSTGAYLISCPHSQTIKAKNSRGFRHAFVICTCFFSQSYFVSRQTSPLRLFHLRRWLIWLFLSSWISSPPRSQVVISWAAPPLSSPALAPCSGPCDVWSRARGGRPDIQPRLWRPSLSVPCTRAPCCEAWRKSGSRENYKSPSSIEQRLKTGGNNTFDSHYAALHGANFKSTYCSPKNQ